MMNMAFYLDCLWYSNSIEYWYLRGYYIINFCRFILHEHVVQILLNSQVHESIIE